MWAGLPVLLAILLVVVSFVGGGVWLIVGLPVAVLLFLVAALARFGQRRAATRASGSARAADVRAGEGRDLRKPIAPTETVEDPIRPT
jgi:hypothetical protein